MVTEFLKLNVSKTVNKSITSLTTTIPIPLPFERLANETTSDSDNPNLSHATDQSENLNETRESLLIKCRSSSMVQHNVTRRVQVYIVMYSTI